MTKLKTPTELTREVFSPDVSTDDLIWTAITRDRQAIREALREGVKNLRPNSECIDYVLRDDIIDLLDELLGVEVTE